MGKIIKTGDGLTGRVLRALGVFGSIEAITMLCAVVRTKLVALWIGTAGVGILSLFNVTMEMLKTVMHLNLRQSAVRQIASAPEGDRPRQLTATRRCAMLLGIISALVVAALSPLLSRLTFGSGDYTWGFAILSLTMLISAVASGRMAILQALDRLRDLAKATLWAALLSTAAAIVLFYLYRREAIVPVLLISAAVSLLMLLTRRIPRSEPIERRPINEAMRAMLRLGGWLTAAMGVTLIADYALRVYLNSTAGVATVGTFQAGYTIANSYIGVIFTAIAMEFFPRLSKTINRRMMTRTIVAHEIALVTRLMLPMVIIFMLADKLIINILYSNEFAAASAYLNVAVTATILRAASWCMAYVIIAKGDGRAYVVTETISAITLICCSIPLWHTWGYAGLGAAYLIQYIVYMIVTAATCRRRYGITLPGRVLRQVTLFTLISIAVLALKLML